LRLSIDTDHIEGLAAGRDALRARVGAAEFITDNEKRLWGGRTCREMKK